MALEIEELGPGSHIEEIPRLSGDVLDEHIFIVLRSVGTHLELKHAGRSVDFGVAQDHVARAYALTSEGEHAGTAAEVAVLDEHVGVGAVVGILVSPGALAALETDYVVVDRDVAAGDVDVVAGVEVDRVGARRGYGLVGSEDGHVLDANIVALIEVGGPEAGIAEGHALEEDVPALGDIDHSRAQGLEIGAVGVHAAACPEVPPVLETVAVDHSFTGNREAVDAIGVYKSRDIRLDHPFDMYLADLVVRDVVAALENRPLLEMKVGAGLEEKRARKEHPFRNDHGAALLGREVDDLLDRGGLEQGAVPDNAVVGDHEAPGLLSGNPDGLGTIFPSWSRRAILLRLKPRFLKAGIRS